MWPCRPAPFHKLLRKKHGRTPFPLTDLSWAGCAGWQPKVPSFTTPTLFKDPSSPSAHKPSASAREAPNGQSKAARKDLLITLPQPNGQLPMS